MAITPWQAGGILNQKQYFEPGERGGYGIKLPIDPSPAVLGASTLAGGILGPLGTGGTTGTGVQPCANPAHVRNAAGQCVPRTTGDGPHNNWGCQEGFTRDTAGRCVQRCADGGTPPCDDGTRGCVERGLCPDCTQPPCGGGDLTCAQRGLVPDGMGGCKPKDDTGGTGPSVGCPEAWARDQWGICRPIHHIRSEGPDFTHVGGKENAINIATECRWGRNPHTGQCNPNPTFGQDEFLGSPTALGGLPTGNASGGSAYISGAGLEALDRNLYPIGPVSQSGFISGPEDMGILSTGDFLAKYGDQSTSLLDPYAGGPPSVLELGKAAKAKEALLTQEEGPGTASIESKKDRAAREAREDAKRAKDDAKIADRKAKSNPTKGNDAEAGKANAVADRLEKKANDKERKAQEARTQAARHKQLQDLLESMPGKAPPSQFLYDI